MNIIPAILVSTFSELKKQLKQAWPIFQYVQLDIMDGRFVKNKSFNYNEKNNLEKFFNEEIKTKLKFELHLMVKNPIEEIKRWKNVKNVFRVIFHIESNNEPMKIIAEIKQNGWQIGIALNPKTPITKITPYLNLVDMVLFMTVNPGKQGNPFIEKVKKKITPINQLTDKPIISIDGGVNEKNIKLIKSWGVDVANVGSALMGTEDVEKAYIKLKKLC